MKVIVDRRMPESAFNKLIGLAQVIFFEAYGQAYPAISGHPDIFFCKTANELIIAPNCPEKAKILLSQNNIYFTEGDLNIGLYYPATSHYNAVITDQLLIHNLQYTDAAIQEKCNKLKHIHVNQAYTRCNLIPLKNDRFITSDKGIEKILIKEGFEVLFVSPQGIILPGFDTGFIGGCCGVFEDGIYFIGSLNHFPEGEKVQHFLSDYTIIELYNGPLFDAGSLLFL